MLIGESSHNFCGIKNSRFKGPASSSGKIVLAAPTKRFRSPSCPFQNSTGASSASSETRLSKYGIFWPGRAVLDRVIVAPNFEISYIYPSWSQSGHLPTLLTIWPFLDEPFTVSKYRGYARAPSRTRTGREESRVGRTEHLRERQTVCSENIRRSARGDIDRRMRAVEPGHG